MALPDNFSPWEHLQSTLMRTYNLEVDEEFRGLDDDDISIPRSSLKVACKIRDDDSALQTLNRMLLFYFTCRRAQDVQAPIFGIPVSDYHEEIQYRPQVTLHFIQDWQAVPEGYSPVRARISFRLQRETTQTISIGEARSIANRIKSEFASGPGYIWTRGRLKVCYRDKIKGYDFRLLVPSESEGKGIISKVLRLQNDTAEWDNLTVSESSRSFPQITGTQLILGKSYRKPRQRPTANVRFRYATLSVHGLPHDIVLCDLTGFYKKALVR
jgi:hypothetical protein